MKFVLLALLFGAPPPAEHPRADIELITPNNHPNQLHSYWKRRQREIKRKDKDRAQIQLEKIATFQKNAGIQRLDAVARALLREASESGDLSNISMAEEIAPGLPDVYHIQAELILEKESFAYHKWAKAKFKGMIASLKDFRTQVVLLSETLLMILLISTVLIAVFIFTQLVRYSANVYYDLGRAFPSLAKFVIFFAVITLFSIPIFYGFGPLSLIFPLTILFWSYQKTREKIFSFVMLLMLALAPWGLRVGNRLTEAGTGSISHLAALSLNPLDERAFKAVNTLVERRKRDWEARVILGLAHKRRGESAQAIELFEEALKHAKGRDAKGLIYNNLGNVHFAMGKPQTAEHYYTKASKALSGSAIPLFNLHRLFSRLGETEKAEQFIQQASERDAQRVAAWGEDDDINLNRYIIDIDISSEQLTSRTFAGLFSSTPLARRIWLSIAGPLPEMSAPLAAVVTLFALSLLILVRQRMILTWPCSKCGKPSLNALIDGYPDHCLCNECHELFVHSKPVERSVRFAKEESIAKLNNVKKLSNMLFSFFPGVVQIAWGRTLEGMILVGMTVFLLARIALPHGVLIDPYLPEASRGFSFWASITLFGLIWLYSLYQTYRLNKELN